VNLTRNDNASVLPDKLKYSSTGKIEMISGNGGKAT